MEISRRRFERTPSSSRSFAANAIKALGARRSGQLGQLGSGERNDAICAIEFRMGKKEVIKRGMEAIDARLRAVLAAPAAPGDFSVVPPK